MSDSSSALLLQVARNLKYRAVPAIIGEKIVISGLDSVVAEVSEFIDRFVGGCSFAGPEQKYRDGQIAKYEILDLRFEAPASELDCSVETGVPLLRQLGFVENELVESFEEDAIGAIGCLEELRDSVAEGKTHLMLFLAAANPHVDELAVMERMARVTDPSRIEFPIQFTVEDACISNSSFVWMNKHFYL